MKKYCEIFCILNFIVLINFDVSLDLVFSFRIIMTYLCIVLKKKNYLF